MINIIFCLAYTYFEISCSTQSTGRTLINSINKSIAYDDTNLLFIHFCFVKSPTPFSGFYDPLLHRAANSVSVLVNFIFVVVSVTTQR